jgi:hypothetical protein
MGMISDDGVSAEYAGFQWRDRQRKIREAAQERRATADAEKLGENYQGRLTAGCQKDGSHNYDLDHFGAVQNITS